MSPTLADVATAAMPRRGGGPQGPRLVPALTLVSHPVPARVGERLRLDALVTGREVALSRNAPDFTRPGSVLGQPLNDPFISRKPLTLAPGAKPGSVRLTCTDGGERVVLAGSALEGTWELSEAELVQGVPLELGGRVVLLLHLLDTADDAPTLDTLGMMGESTGVRRLRRHIERVAQAIHQRSRRRAGRFLSVNLGAIPKELAAGELFGTQKGAYTGATQSREGFFRAAHGGTLFLDEVGEAPAEVQVMLLRVLETGELYPVGGTTPVAVDVRLLAATDADLDERIRDGRFKAPLLHRLAGYEVHVPPLRERREELASLGEAHRLDNEEAYAAPWLPAPLATRLVRFPWPGNIRQLRNLARQLVIGSRGEPTLQAEPRLEHELDVAAAATPGASVSPPEPVAEARPSATPRRMASQVTEQEMLAALRAHAWDLKATDEALGIPRPSLYDLIDESPNLRTAGDLRSDEITRVCLPKIRSLRHECLKAASKRAS